MGARILRNAFNAGELSPLLDARVDAEKYANGARLMENLVPRIYGGAFSRGGFVYMGSVKTAGKKTRLIPFNFSTTTNFVLEMGEGYIRFWSNGEQVSKSSAAAWATTTDYVAGDYVTETSTIYYCLESHASGTFATDLGAGKWVAQSILEVPTGYAEADLFDVQFVQINDLVYFVHADHPVLKLTRRADDDWSIADPWLGVVRAYPPFTDENSDENVTLTANLSSGSGTLTFGGSGTRPFDFSSGHVGSYFRIGHRRSTPYVEVKSVNYGGYATHEPSTEVFTSAIQVTGQWTLTTFGKWGPRVSLGAVTTGIVEVQRSSDGSTNWQTIKAFTGNQDRNVIFTGNELDTAYLRLRVSASDFGTASDPRARFILEPADSTHYAVLRVTSHTSQTQVNVTQVTAPFVNNTATYLWSEGAFNDRRGYPRSVTFHEQRLLYAGSKIEPKGVYGSVTGDFDNFRRSTNDDGSLAYTLAATRGDAIQWMTSQRALLIGTKHEEWTVSGGGEDNPITPTNVRARRQTFNGSEHIAPVLTADAVLFVERGARRVREFVFTYDNDSYASPDLCLLAEHVGRSGFRQVAFATHPDPVLWAVNGDGALVSMTFERDQNVVGWSRHVMSGDGDAAHTPAVESVAVIDGGTDAGDEVWIAVKRYIDGAWLRYIERMDPRHLQKQEAGAAEQANLICLDSARVVTLEEPGTTVEGLDHLEGQTVNALADGTPRTGLEVADGAITLPVAAQTVVAGLPYTCRLQASKVELPLGDGTLQGRRVRANTAAVRTWRSHGGKYGRDPEHISYDLPATDATLDAPAETDVIIDGAWERSIDFALEQDAPLPLNVLAWIVDISPEGRP